MIVGQPGAGKTWLALRLADVTGLTVTHVDRLHWLPGWRARPETEKRRMIEDAVAADAWIIEGRHAPSYATRLGRADCVVWIDRAFGVRFSRLLGRRLAAGSGSERRDLPDGCRQGIDRRLLRELWHALRTRRTERRRIGACFDAVPPGIDRIRLTTDAEVRAFLDRAGGPPR